MMNNKTAAGLSYPSMFSEILLLTISVGYSMHFGYALTTYAEVGVILVQCYIVMFLAYRYKQISFFQFISAASLCLTVLSLYVLDVVPEQVYSSNQLIISGLSNLRNLI